MTSAVVTDRSPWAVGAIGVGGVVGCAVVVQVAGDDDGFSLCPVRRWTGGWCPGCGAARAARHVMHGDVSAAWADHPWLVLFALQMVVALPLVWATHRSGRAVSANVIAVLGSANTVILLGVWLVRIRTGEIPSPI